MFEIHRPMARAARAAFALGLIVVGVGGAASTHPVAASGVTCSGAVQHPLAVRVEALDPVRRGATVRLRVQATSRGALSSADVQLVHAGGASIAGARRVSLGSMRPNRARQAEFIVALPAQGERFLVEFKVRGEGPHGPIARGATYNLLPDGAQQPARVVTNPAGEQVAEYAARRIDR